MREEGAREAYGRPPADQPAASLPPVTDLIYVLLTLLGFALLGLIARGVERL